MFKVLVAEDDIYLSGIIKEFLEGAGFMVKTAPNGEIAYNEFCENHYDILLADIMMPKVDGNELVERIKKKKKDFPVIMLTALDKIGDKTRSFENGADDYLTKPVDFAELKLRINALLRRYNIAFEKIISHKNAKLDYNRLTLEICGAEAELTKKEFLLLYKLVASPGRIFSREQLLDEIWGYDTYSIERTVDVHINKIREKLSGSEIEVQTVRGLGYKAVLK